MREGWEIAMKMSVFGAAFAALFALMLWDLEPPKISIMASGDDQAPAPPKPVNWSQVPPGYACLTSIPIGNGRQGVAAYTPCSATTSTVSSWVATSQ